MSCVQYNIDMETYEIQYLKLPNGKAPVTEWLDSLDGSFRKRINQRILRIEEGNFGDHKSYRKIFQNCVLTLVKVTEFITRKSMELLYCLSMAVINPTNQKISIKHKNFLMNGG